MATRLSQIRLSRYCSRPAAPASRDTFNPPSSEIKANPIKRSLRQALHRHERMAHPQTKPQQTGPRRPNHVSHNQENSIRSRPGGARALPETYRKPHRQDWEQNSANLMKSLPRQPKQRRPLQDINYNAEQRTAPHGPRRQRAPGPEASTESLQTQQHLSNMYSMIDDHLAWNMSASDVAYQSPEPPRPSSSGTMFVDFGSNGEVEVSYRSGVNKKLPTPPVPSKTTASSKFAFPRQAADFQDVRSGPQRDETKQAKPKPLPPRLSYSSRHDSVMSSGAQHSEHTNSFITPPLPPPTRPLPPLPTQTLVNPHSRKSHPPQVHTTSRSASATKVHASPALSTASMPTYHTARDIDMGDDTKSTVHAVIKPNSLTTSRHTADLHAIKESPYPEVRPSSLAPSHTDTYKEVSPNPSAYARSSTSVPLEKLDTNKPLPPLPRMAQDFTYRGTRCEIPVVLKKEQKRRKVFAFVKKVLCKMGDLSGEFNQHKHRYERVEERRRCNVA